MYLSKCFFENNRIIYPLIEPHPAFSLEENQNYDPIRPGMAFMGINREIADFECSRDAFIGMYQSETNPWGVEQDTLSDSILEGGVPCAALRSPIELQPGEKKDLIVVLGFALTTENGIFAHAQSWAIVAECLLGRSSYAFDYYSSILPIKRNHEADVLKIEPYVYCQTISSEDSLHPGEGANSWLNGTASWMYVAFTQYILGIRPTLEGLVVQPRIPGEWNGFKAERIYMGCRYQINCTRTGNPGISVNGLKINGDLLPHQSGKECWVDVEV